jgi:hypothetical protein
MSFCACSKCGRINEESGMKKVGAQRFCNNNSDCQEAARTLARCENSDMHIPFNPIRIGAVRATA